MPETASTRPYLIRALYEWCTDNGFTPYVAVLADETTQVPREYVKNGEIVLNISFDATSSLKLGNEYIEFKARFAGMARDIVVPVDRVLAIYARENGQGMAFPAPNGQAVTAAARTKVESAGLPADGLMQVESKTARPAPLAPVNPGALGKDPLGPSPRPSGASGQRPRLKRIK